MRRVIVAEYDANEKALRLAQPLPGVADHQKVRISVEGDEKQLRSNEPGDPLVRLASLGAPTADIGSMLSEIVTGRR